MWKELKVALDFIRPWVNLPIICQNTKYHLHLRLYIYNLFCSENIVATLAQGDWKGLFFVFVIQQKCTERQHFQCASECHAGWLLLRY